MDADIRPIRNDMHEAMATDASRPVRRKISRYPQLTGAYVSLSLFMVVYCARPQDWIPGLSNAPLAKIAGVLALIAFVLSIGQLRQRLPREVIFLLLLTAQLFATVPMSPVWRGGAFQTTLDFAKVGLIVLVMVMSVNTLKRLRHILFIHAASVAAVASIAAWKGRLLGNRLSGVLNGNYSNPNDLALAIVISLPLCLALLLLSKNVVWKIGWAFAMAIMAYALLLTGSRGGFISLAVTTAVSLWGFAVQGRRPYLLVLSTTLGAVLWVSSGAMLGERLKGTFDSKDDAASAYGSAQERQELFWRSVEVTREHPLFGIGPGNFQVVSGSWHVTHNSYTQMSSEGGVPALILYVMILWCGFKNVRAIKLMRKNKDVTLLAQALHASLAGFVIGSLFSSVAYQFFPYFLVAYTRSLLWMAKGSVAQMKGQKPLSDVAPAEEIRVELIQPPDFAV